MRNDVKIECEGCNLVKDDVYYREGTFKFLCNACAQKESEKDKPAEI